jgi:DNA-binding CsgD family transcriptional regulator
MDWSDLKPRERSLIRRLTEALLHAQALPELVRSIDEFLLSLVSADCMALCTTQPGQLSRYDWWVARMPTSFFDRSPEWSRDDFLRDGVARQPRTVLLDTDLISRTDLRSNSMHRISREEGTPLEHAISILMPHPEREGHSGFTAYRSRPRPFSERDRSLVQYVWKLLASALYKCQVFREREFHERLLNAQEQNLALLVLGPSAEVIRRTEGVSTLVRKWFSTAECSPSGVPLALVAKWTALAHGVEAETRTWECAGEAEGLKVTFTPLPGSGPACWQLKFEEAPHPLLVTWLKVLTAMEREILYLLLQGLSDKEIAPKAGCAVGTVKVHLKSIYRKTRTQGRTDLLARALKWP